MKKLLNISAAIAASALIGAPAFAADKGDTSGPAVGTPVNPSTAVQKRNTHVGNNNTTIAGPSGMSAGVPGVEGKRGTQSGEVRTPPPKTRHN